MMHHAQMGPQRILICGAGSIGERHIRNLLHLGYTEIALYRQRNRPLRTLLLAKRHFPIYRRLEKALSEFAPTIVFVTNPTAYHLEVAQPAAEAGCHLFIEKPLSHSLVGLDRLQNTLAHHGTFAMVGYMMRFHPLLQKVQSWLADGELGKPLWIRSSWGEHAPDWHPWEDYRRSYAMQRVLGGGPTLTLSHELDILVWLFGPALDVVSMSHHDSPLETDCEHAVDILLRFKDGVIGNVHLDYWQRPPHRLWELVATRGRVQFDYYAGTLTHWDGVIGEQSPAAGANQPQAHEYRVPDGWDRNEMFIAELNYFFQCLEDGVQPQPDLLSAAESVRIAQASLPLAKRR